MDFETEIDRLRTRVAPLSKFVHALCKSMPPPKFFRTEFEAGFRYEKPELVHFCLLRSVRVVSALNASIELARYGYSQEIGVLLRTAIEYDSQITFMIASRRKDGSLSPDADAFVSSFFKDANRPGSNEDKKARLVQKRIHNTIGARLDGIVGRSKNAKTASEMMTNVYVIFSNYVHAKYPESMDLYGGGPAHFHLKGMSRTPKDMENLEILETLITSASICMAGLAQAFEMRDVLNSDPELATWYNRMTKTPS